jgi:hypothetical protein
MDLIRAIAASVKNGRKYGVRRKNSKVIPRGDSHGASSAFQPAVQQKTGAVRAEEVRRKRRQFQSLRQCPDRLAFEIKTQICFLKSETGSESEPVRGRDQPNMQICIFGWSKTPRSAEFCVQKTVLGGNRFRVACSIETNWHDSPKKIERSFPRGGDHCWQNGSMLPISGAIAVCRRAGSFEKKHESTSCAPAIH